MLKKTAIVSSQVPHRISDCCFRSSRKRGRPCQASASIPRSAIGNNHTICPPNGSLKSLSRPGLPVLNMPLLPPLLPLTPCSVWPVPPTPVSGKSPVNVPVPVGGSCRVVFPLVLLPALLP